MKRHAATVALGIALLSLTYGAPDPAGYPALGIAFVLLVVLARRFEVSRFVRISLSAGVFAVSFFWARAAIPIASWSSETISPIAFSFGLSFAWVAVVRNAFREPIGGDALTVLWGLCALACAGRASEEPFYAVAILSFLVVSAVALMQDDAGVGARSGKRQRRMAMAVLGSTLLVGMAGAATVPLAEHWVVRKLTPRDRMKTGFSDAMSLGSLEDMLVSDRIVARVHGERIDYLRGAVFTSYAFGRWSQSYGEELEPQSLPSASDEELSETRVEFLTAQDRFFTPIDTVGLRSHEEREVLVDRFGVVRPRPRHDIFEYWVLEEVPGPNRARPYDRRDGLMPKRIFSDVRALASAWTEGADSYEEKLERIEIALAREYSYTLDLPRVRGEPMKAFLFDHKKGNCEYFASAFALLARSIGIPARVVAGYRVVEHHPFAPYWIVRERDAHSWVEVYLPERGWTTYDPTPPRFGPQTRRASVVEALGDYAYSQFTAFTTFVGNRSVLELSGGLVVMFGALFVARYVRKRRESGRERATARGAEAFLGLEAALAKRGLARGMSETLERFARRLRESSLDIAVAEAVEAYAAHRYGDIGDVEDATRGLHQATERVRRVG